MFIIIKSFVSPLMVKADEKVTNWKWKATIMDQIAIIINANESHRKTMLWTALVKGSNEEIV